MSTTFDFIQIWIPSLEKFKSFSLITNHQFKSLVKYSANFVFKSVQWTIGFSKCLLRIVEENCLEKQDFKFSQLSAFDLLVIFLNLKTASVDPRLSLNMKCEQTKKDFRKDILLDDIERELLKFPYKKENLEFQQTINSLKIELGLPRFFIESFETLEDVYIEQIASVIYKFGDIDTIDIPYKHLLNMVEKLPVNITERIFTYYKSQEYIAKNLKLFELVSPFSNKVELTQTFSISKNFLVQFCKILFQDDLESIYKLYYKGMREIRLDSKFLDEITPIELRAVFFKFYKTDIERQKAEQENSHSSN